MSQLLLRCCSQEASGPCGLCGDPTTLPPGTQLIHAANQAPVCAACGRRHAPPLAALAHLAGEAARVGRIGRHSVFPPYTALLDLARAADRFATPAPPGPRHRRLPLPGR